MYRREGKPAIFLVAGYTDFRCGINGLLRKLTEVTGVDPKANALFVFMPKRKKSLKMIYWGGSGYWLLQYRLEEGHFKWIKEAGIRNISYKQMEWLLDGLSIDQKNFIPEYKIPQSS